MSQQQLSEIKASNDAAIAALDVQIARYQQLVLALASQSESTPPAPDARQPGTFGAGRAQ